MNSTEKTVTPTPGPGTAHESPSLDSRTSHVVVHIRGKAVSVPSTQLDGKTVVTSGNWLKTAMVQDEELQEGETFANPESFVRELKKTRLHADIFTFAQKLSDTKPRFTHHLEWDNLAVIPITTFSDWWDRRVESSVRRAVRKAAKSGIVVKEAEFDDAFVQGIVNINNETPIRQGRTFWHYQKNFDAVKLEHATYRERTAFLGAYYECELIGYIRITYANNVASIIQILGMMKHFDKRPANALIAKAVEICAQQGISYLTYCNYVYNNPDSSLTEFKRRNGFEQVLVPRYYIPLTLKGKTALILGMHHGLVGRIPRPLVKKLLRVRSLWYERRLKAAQETP